MTNATDDGTIPAMETICPSCEGRGWVRDAGQRTSCAVCEGAGNVPTAFGERVLSLVRHNLGAMLTDVRS
jgi:DnaJ-class molecular chaperone